MKNLKHITLTMFLVIGMAGALLAEDKYEFASVRFIGTTAERALWVSISGKEFQKIEIAKDKVKAGELTPVMDYLKKMSEEGWELVGTTTSGESGHIHNFILKRKVKQ